MNRVTSVSWVLCLVAAVVAAVFWHELRTERARHADLAARIAALESVRSEQAATASALPGPAATAGSAALIPPAAGSAGQHRDDSNPAALGAALQEMVRSPGGQELQRVFQRQALIDRYPDLKKVLGLSSAEADRLLDLLVRNNQEMSAERLRIASDRSLDRAAREEQSRLLAERERANEGEIANLLGDKYDSWKEYERTSMDRQRQRWEQQGREDLRAAISTSSNPLSPAMFDPLVKALDAEQKKIDEESIRLSAADRLQRMPQDQQRMLDAASAYLNSGQMERYRRYLDGQVEMLRGVAGMVEMAERTQSGAPSPRQ